MNPNDASQNALLTRALSLQRADKYAEAETLCRTIVDKWPDSAQGQCTHGVALFHLNRLEEAVQAFRIATELQPDYANAQCNLGAALHRLKRYREAETAFRAALSAHPDYARAQTGLAAALQESRKQGVTVAKINISMGGGGKPAVKTVRAEGTIAERRRREAQDVIEAYRQAAEQASDSSLAAAQLFFELRHACEWETLAEAERRVEELTQAALERGAVPGEHAFINIARKEDTAANLQVARLHANAITQKLQRRDAQVFAHSRPTPSDRRIRLGYLSADFRDHAIGHLIAGLFAHHDRERFEVIAYSHGEDDDSDFRKRVMETADTFTDLETLSDEAAAQKIHDDQVDILVDLSGQIRGNRLEITALRPAPVQVAYIGFPGSNGADFIDYVFTDKTVTPPEHLENYSEAPAYVPHCYLITDDQQPISDIAVTRRAQNLPEDGVVFCSFNQGFKITPDVFDAWCRTMAAVNGSVLWLLEKNPLTQFNLRAEAAARGVAGERLIFANRVPKPEHMARTRLADLALDTGIYTGHVTTCDMLWAGVPVITKLGNHFASRVSASALQAAGLEALITHSWSEFSDVAIRLSQDADRLSDLRARLQNARGTAPLFDTARSVRALESGFEEMWRIHCAGEAPRRIDIPDA